MTNIDELEGRELDAAVAHEITGEHAWGVDPPCYRKDKWPTVLDAMEAQGYWYKIQSTKRGEKWAEFGRWDTHDGAEGLAIRDSTGDAVCVAALRALRARASEGVTHD